MNDLATALQGRSPGERVSLTVMRGQQERSVAVVLGRRPQTADGPTLIPPRGGQSTPANVPPETVTRRPPPPGEAIDPGRPAEPRTEQARLDLLERRLAELERRLAELERLLSRRP
jgi:hypothetical protein